MAVISTIREEGLIGNNETYISKNVGICCDNRTQTPQRLRPQIDQIRAHRVHERVQYRAERIL